MNIVDYALRHIRTRIPQEALSKAFTNDSIYRQHDSVSMDWLVRRDVIEQRVLLDLNVIGGEHVSIPIRDLSPVAVEGGYIYKVPLSKTKGRYISRVISVERFDNRGGTGYSDPLTNAAERMLSASVPFEGTGIADVRLVAPNTIVVHETMSGFAELRCVLEYDDQLSSLSQSYWRDFANLCVMACESIIYNRISIQLGSGSNTGGSPNDRLVSRIDEMADADVRYQEQLDTKWHKVSLMSDHKAKLEVIQLSLGGY